MAFRIHDSVARGEIDNRIKGVVRGRLWLEGRPEPVVLELRGNAHPDLAGCLLTFTNPQPRPRPSHIEGLAPVQRGTIGDLTASRKVRVFDIPTEEALGMIRRNEKPPERLANALYLEWFSEANGRVVIESANYVLEISPPEWRLTPQDEARRAQEAEAGMAGFIRTLDETIQRHQLGQKDPDLEWDEHDYERFMREADARTDKYGELLDKYGHSDEAQERIEREMGWDRDETEAEDSGMSIDELNAACDAAANEPPPEPEPHREGIDWVRTADGGLRHPLEHRCFECAVTYYRFVQDLGMKSAQDSDMEQFVAEFQITGAKLAGALNGIARGEGYRDGAFTVALLKRALGHLHQAQAGLEAVNLKRLLPERLVAAARQDLFEIRAGILALMDEFRAR
ncbi:MAG TPA: hypothetical protein P5534_17800 [Candidatus Paceibacterota bacterium]|nr:hypothetical protein [Candidatus Paceibacterota bacterium]